jgi:hypothetical protein
MCKVDLKDAYTVVPIHTESWDFLSFENQGMVYRYTSLAFGWSVAPRGSCKSMRHAIEQLWREGIWIIYYLDGICILEKSKDKMHKTVLKIRKHLEVLGFIINYFKSILILSKEQEF